MSRNQWHILIVSENILSMLDCTLMIRSLSDREIEIHVDPRKQLQQDQNVQSESTDEHCKPDGGYACG